MVRAFERSSNYPKTREGEQLLAQGLKRAFDSTGIPMQEIIEECLGLSAFCPTDADLLKVASEIKIRRMASGIPPDQQQQWERQYGPPKPFDWAAEAEKILPASKEYWRKDRAAIKIIKREMERRKLKPNTISHRDWLELRLAAQQEVGLPAKPEQLREWKRVTT